MSAIARNHDSSDSLVHLVNKQRGYLRKVNLRNVTPEHVVEMARMRDEGMTNRAIAKVLGFEEQSVRRHLGPKHAR